MVGDRELRGCLMSGLQGGMKGVVRIGRGRAIGTRWWRMREEVGRGGRGVIVVRGCVEGIVVVQMAERDRSCS